MERRKPSSSPASASSAPWRSSRRAVPKVLAPQLRLPLIGPPEQNTSLRVESISGTKFQGTACEPPKVHRLLGNHQPRPRIARPVSLELRTSGGCPAAALSMLPALGRGRSLRTVRRRVQEMFDPSWVALPDVKALVESAAADAASCSNCTQARPVPLRALPLGPQLLAGSSGSPGKLEASALVFVAERQATDVGVAKLLRPETFAWCQCTDALQSKCTRYLQQTWFAHTLKAWRASAPLRPGAFQMCSSSHTANLPQSDCA